MDMERIKQNLRLRSGRMKKTKKAPTAPQAQNLHLKQEKDLPQRPVSQPQKQRTISAQGREDSPSLRNWDQETALPQKNGQRPESVPEEPQANSQSPDTRPKTAKRNESARYGRSGIERNQSQSQEQAANMAQEPNSTAEKESTQPNKGTASSDEPDFDLRAPPSKPKPTSIDTLCEMLFSEGHLNILIHDPAMMSRFSAFLQRYKPNLSAVVLQYLEYQKAIKAIEYANAVAESIEPNAEIQDGNRTPTQDESDSAGAAAELSTRFAQTSQRAYDLLVHEALPAYVTYTLVRLSTECLTAEITSHAPTSLTANLIGGLSEVFCLSDPTLPDNPLIYCSEEFYRLTGYASGDVLGQNCRFLQGPKTDWNSVRRIKEAVEGGEGCNETVLNYRRDGRGFVNVLMISPLEDDKGQVKYFLGAQVDVSRLIAGGWGLEGLERLVQKKEKEEARGRRVTKSKKDHALRKLRELSEMFDVEESTIVRSHSRSSSVDSGVGSAVGSVSDRPKQARRIFGDDGSDSNDDGSETETEAKTEKERGAWKLATTGSSGKLPGLYQRYLLIRPAPSLRIIFVSPALRKEGNIGQKPFLSHLAAPAATLSGLKDSFASGTPVTAKVAFMAQPSSSREGQTAGRWRRTNSKSKDASDLDGADKDPSTYGRTCWISATPLLGSDDDIGVWMVVLVDKNSAPASTLSKTKGQGMKHQQLEGRALGIVKAGERNNEIQLLSDDIRKDDVPIKATRVGGTSANGTPRKPESPAPPEDRKAAREMYDNDGNPAVQQEADDESTEAGNDVAQEEKADESVPETDGIGEEHPPESGASGDGPSEPDADLEKVPNKASSADDEDSGPGPAEEEDDEYYTVNRDEHEPSNKDGPSETVNDQNEPNHQEQGSPNSQRSNAVWESDDDSFVRRHSQPLTPPSTKERVIIRSDSFSDGGREAGLDTAANASFPGKQDDDEDDYTPTRTRHDHAGGLNREEGGGTSSSRAPGYMDYLRHPGSLASGKTPSDPDCEVWSPYSVD